MILPGATLGVLGGGQLGRMFCLAAQTMGYRVLVLEPDPESPAGSVADEHLCAAYTDPAALARMGQSCAAVTTEFENVPAESLRYLQAHCRVFPTPEAVALTRDRILEKGFLREHGIPTAPFVAIQRREELGAALERIGAPALLKTATFGYDGKGQARVAGPQDLDAAFTALGEVACVLERRVVLEREVSVVLARAASAEVACYPVAENLHENGILDTTIVPARVPGATGQQALQVARQVADALDYVGVMAVEFFVTADGELLVNEIAPRPHNSGHYTLDACASSQFEQQVRMLCGLPAGDVRLLSPAVMINLLGDCWGDSAPAWERLLEHPEIRLHLYGKREARRGRKMGHFNCLAEDAATALAIARRARQGLCRNPLSG